MVYGCRLYARNIDDKCMLEFASRLRNEGDEHSQFINLSAQQSHRNGILHKPAIHLPEPTTQATIDVKTQNSESNSNSHNNNKQSQPK